MAADPVHRPARHRPFLNDAAALRSHLRQWRAVAGRPGPRAMARAALPGQQRRHCRAHPLATGQTLAVHRRHPPLQGAGACASPQRLRPAQHPHRRVERPGFQRLLVRRLVQWRDVPVDAVIAGRSAHGPATGARLRPGKPLRALAVQGNDTKFLNATPACSPLCWTSALTAKPAARGWWFFGRAARRRPLAAHRPAGPGLLPFAQMRASELQTTPLPGSRILLVRNERCLHQLPAPVQDTIAVLGAGLNLGWLAAPWLQERSVAYWGDLDTWGLPCSPSHAAMCRTPGALLMDRRHVQRPPPQRWLNRCTHPSHFRWRTDARRSRTASAPACAG